MTADLKQDAKLRAVLWGAAFYIGFAKAGFGGAVGLVATPLLALVMPAKRSVALALPLLLLTDIANIGMYWGMWDLAAGLWLLPGGVVGTFMATRALVRLPDYWVKKTLGILALTFAPAQLAQMLIFPEWAPGGARTGLVVRADWACRRVRRRRVFNDWACGRDRLDDLLSRRSPKREHEHGAGRHNDNPVLLPQRAQNRNLRAGGADDARGDAAHTAHAADARAGTPGGEGGQRGARRRQGGRVHSGVVDCGRGDGLETGAYSKTGAGRYSSVRFGQIANISEMLSLSMRRRGA